jgi:ATP synthase protein I
MAKNARDTGPEKPPATDEAHLSARLRRLGDELGREQARDAGNIDRGPTAGDPSAFARGFRLSTELIAGVLVGAVIGFGLDRLLGISPWGLIVFVLLGFVAGVLNVMRASGAGPGSGSNSRT